MVEQSSSSINICLSPWSRPWCVATKFTEQYGNHTLETLSMRAVTLEHDRHAMSIASMSGSEWFGSQVQGKAFLASQSNTLKELGDVACRSVDTVTSEKSRKLLCVCIQQQLLREVCELSPLRALNSTDFISPVGWPMSAISFKLSYRILFMPKMRYN